MGNTNPWAAQICRASLVSVLDQGNLVPGAKPQAASRKLQAQASSAKLLKVQAASFKRRAASVKLQAASGKL
jgi:hypothetical protein